MPHIKVPYKSKKYTASNVEVLISDSVVRFLRITGDSTYAKEIYKGMQKSTAVVMEQMRKQIQAMGAVYSGFLRANVVGFVAPTPYDVYGTVESYIGTKAYYDIYIHEGLGRFSPSGKDPIPTQYEPTAEQLAVVPSWAEKKRLTGKKYFIDTKRGPRPFATTALMNSYSEVLDIMGDSVVKAIRNVIAKTSRVPRRQLKDALLAVNR